MNLRRFLLPVLLLLTACANVSGDKYPFPPQFVSSEEVCPCTLGAPPAKDSREERQEITGIIARQAHLSVKEKATIAAEDHITPAMIVTPVLGADINEETHPALFALLKHAASDAWRTADTTQEFWSRQRPFLVDARVALLVGRIERPSYPSGHSTTNHVWAYVLSDLFPQKREALLRRAHDIGMHRVAAGVHYPSDVAAGKRLAATIYLRMKATPQFRQELAAARAELYPNTVTNPCAWSASACSAGVP